MSEIKTSGGKVVYLDNNATTSCDSRVLDKMVPFFSDKFGNPASSHAMGEEAAEAVGLARIQVANLLGVSSEHIYFTNSATESNNIILKSVIGTGEIVTSNVEHSSVDKAAEASGRNVLKIPIHSDGNLDYLELERVLNENKVSLVSIMAVNNEIGTIFDLKRIGDMCKTHGVLFHTDAAQAVGRIDIDVDDMNIYALTMSGHKIYGPKGVGAMYVRDIGPIKPLLHGGCQNIVSSGTQNVAGIVGLGEACELVRDNYDERSRLKDLRDQLLVNLMAEIPDLIINGTMQNRVSNNLNISIPNIPSEVFIRGMDDVILSGGSACKSGDIEPSKVVLALGNPHSECALRMSVGRRTTAQDIEYASRRIIEVAKAIRGEA